MNFIYYKCYILIELTSLKELIRQQTHQKIKGFKFQPNVCNRCYDLLMMTINFSDILNIKGSNCCRIISGISKNEAIN